jgi:hypothetical protein
MHCNSHLRSARAAGSGFARSSYLVRVCNRSTRCDVHPTVGIFEAVDCNGAYHLGVSARPILR